MNKNSLIHINGSYTIGYMYRNIHIGSKGKYLDLFIARHIINNTLPTNNTFLKEGILILRNEIEGYTLKDPKLSDKVKLLETKKHMLDNVAKSFGVKKYTHLNF